MSIKLSLVIFVFALFQAGCGKEEIQMLQDENQKLKATVESQQAQVEEAKKSDDELKFLTAKESGIKAKIVTNMGDIEIRLFPELAPITCFAFISRAEAGYYDNTQFHRIIPGFMIQGGDPNSKDKNPYDDGQGGPILSIPHEFNEKHHGPGILSMARVGDVTQGAGSQFFIVHGDAPHLDKQYTAFGEVASGMDVVDKIAKVKTVTNDPRLQNRPVTPVIIKKISVFR